MTRSQTIDANSFFDSLAIEPSTKAFEIDGLLVTRAELIEASEAAAYALAEMGFHSGDTLALWLPDGAAWLQFLFAAARIGVLIVPISTRYRAREAEQLLTVARAKGIVATSHFLKDDFTSIARSLAERLPKPLIIIDGDVRKGFFEFNKPPASYIWPKAAVSAALCTFSTSGTTGEPKLAAHTQASLLQHSKAVAKALAMSAETVTLCPLPLYGVLGFVTALATLTAGGRCIFQPVFDSAQAAALIDDKKVTHLFGSDAMLDGIIRTPGRHFSSWRHGGFAEFASLGRSLIEFAEENFGISLCGIYGSSECYALMALRSPSLPAEQRALPGGAPTSSEIKFRIVDVNDGAQLADGMSGELQISGPNVMQGYLNNSEATRAVMTDDGWYRTGDLAYAAGDGFVFQSRLKDNLRLHGYLVDPGEIETFLASHKAVVAAQVVGVRRNGVGDVAVAFVRFGAEKCVESDLLAFCREGIAAYKIPKRLIPVEDFPQVAGPNGVKILKNKLREMAEAYVP